MQEAKSRGSSILVLRGTFSLISTEAELFYIPATVMKICFFSTLYQDLLVQFGFGDF